MKGFFKSAARAVTEQHETNLVRLPSIRTRTRDAAGHDSRALIHWKACDACTDRGHRDSAHSVLARETKRVIHR